MVVTVCPLDDTSEESACTLQFASRVRSISLPAAGEVCECNVCVVGAEGEEKRDGLGPPGISSHPPLSLFFFFLCHRPPLHSTQGRGAAARIKNLETEVKALKSEARSLAIKRAQAEEALAVAKREQVALQRRLAQAGEAKGRWAEEASRAMAEQLAMAKAAQEALAGRAAQERAGKEKLTKDLDEAQKMVGGRCVRVCCVPGGGRKRRMQSSP